jgi:peptidoglycan hydrolase CwlO-like protein
VTRFFVFAFVAALLITPSFWAEAEVSSADVDRHKAELTAQLAQLENEIAQQTTILQDKQKERVSLERDVAILDAQIEKAKLSIKARDLSIQTLTSDIGDKANTIVALDDKLGRERQSLAAIFRKTNEIDDSTVMEFLLSSQTVSDFFSDLDSFAAIKANLQDSFAEIADTKVETADAKTKLEERRAEQQQLRQLQVLEQNKIVVQQKERQGILNATKGQEAAYQNIIKSKQKSAAQIRSELFSLRDSAAIPFGTALDLANFASQKTGVRAALILGVLKQETDLGSNLGTGSYTTDMHPTRDVPVFLAIAQTLGYNASTMPVSKQPGYGWGGAMGPGQFIPSTWACYGGFVNVSTGKCGKGKDGSYAGPWQYVQGSDLVRKYTGKATPSDPWDNRDAFMATALLMKENGAAAGTYSAERLAALRYFAGWGNANKSAYAFYGDGVMEHATFFQNQIDILGG